MIRTTKIPGRWLAAMMLSGTMGIAACAGNNGFPSVNEGTLIRARADNTVTSRNHREGDPITATVAAAVTDSSGHTVIPAGALLVGSITDIAPAEHPGGQGRLALRFDQVRFGGETYPVRTKVTSIGSRMKGRGVTGGEALKVGVGAAAGAVAGRIIGGNTKGAVIGGAAGAAAGTGYAVATRDIDVVMPAGAAIQLQLVAPFVLERSEKTASR